MWAKSSFWFQYQIARIKGWFQNNMMLRMKQHLSLKILQKHIRTHIPFYQNKDCTQLTHLPIVDKSIVQDSFNELNALKLSLDNAHLQIDDKQTTIFAQQSLGTSGNPGTYLYSQKEALQAIISTLTKILPPFFFKPPTLAMFHLSPTPYFPKLASSTCFDWHFFDLHQNFEADLVRLQQIAPDVIIAPSQTLCRLAYLQKNRSINLKLQRIISTQEVMTAHEEELIASSFLQNVYQLYQCAEGCLGATCEYGTFHMDEDQFFIEKEWIDETKQRFIPVITSLHRKLQPLVRYRMEDILATKFKPCPCANPMLAFEKIVGRCEDMLYFSDFSKRSALKPIYSDNIHLAINRAGGNIQKYQLLQYSAHHVVIKMQAENVELAKRSIEKQFEKLSIIHGVACPSLEFLPLDPQPLHQMFRQTQRLIKNPD
jgi:putative adenylate-forming enzyme